MNLLEKLREWMRSQQSVAVAYSGGVDSTLVLKLAYEELGERAVGMLAVSASLPKAERIEAERIAQLIGVTLLPVETDELDDVRYQANAANRCYFCKENVYSSLRVEADAIGFSVLTDGMNADDTFDLRPGRAAARELGVLSPLHELGITKAQVRDMAKQLGLPNWDKPAAACLSSRIPYGTPVTKERLSQIEQAEDAMRGLGFSEVRVRHHGDVARIELPLTQLSSALSINDQIVTAIKRCGYSFVAIDLEGLRSGSLNEPLLNRASARTLVS
jgi:pyridinium-3,5-biscarboxylic acid mononucleotide sulfurtransferase